MWWGESSEKPWEKTFAYGFLDETWTIYRGWNNIYSKSNNQQKRKIFEGLTMTISNRGFIGDYWAKIIIWAARMVAMKSMYYFKGSKN